MVTKWLYDRADWTGLHEFNNSAFSSFDLPSDPSSATEIITETIRRGMNKHIPHKTYNKKINSPLWFNYSCAIAIKNKEIAFKKYNKFKTSQTLNNYKHARDHSKRIIKIAKNNFLHKQTNRLINNPNNNKIFWSTLNSFNTNFNSHSSVPPLRSPDGGVISDSKGKADLLAHMFAKNSTLQEDGRGVPRLDMDAAVRIKNLIIKTKEVKNILKNLKLDKAPGPDEIPPVVLKNCSSELSPILARLFRLSIKTSVFPTPWKYGNIHPIPKKGNRSEPSNYRPITLTSTISKTFETIINKHIIKHLENNKLINDRQYGFRSGRSTADLIAYLTHNIHQTIENLGETHAIALDISKAFDRVWHPALLSKLNSYGLSPFSSWISSFLSGRRVRVVLDGLFSDFFSINAGVPQGSVLAPTLFLIHINDLLSDTTSNPIHSYADDSTLHSSIKSKPSNLQDAHDNISRTLNSDLAKVSEWGYKNMVNFNPDKTQYIKFSNRTNHTHPQITFNDTNISPSPSIEILGITLTSTLSWTP